MDGVSAAASIIAVIHISTHVYKHLEEYASEVKSAQTDIQSLRKEVLALQEILKKVLELVNSSHASKFSTLALLNQHDGPADLCARQLEGIRRKLDKNRGMSKVGWRSLTWPFKSEEVSKTISALEGYKSDFVLALTADIA